MVSPQAAATRTDDKPISVLESLGSSRGGVHFDRRAHQDDTVLGKIIFQGGRAWGLSPEERGMDPGQGERWVFSKHFPNASQRAVFSRLKAK